MEFRDKTAELAIEQGLKEMELTKEQAVITVVEEGGFLKKAKVEIVKKPSQSEKTLAFIKGLMERMNIAADASLVDDADGATITVSGKDTGMLIGYRGDVLDSVQYIASLVLNDGGGEYKRLNLNCENYREKREEILKGLALKLAGKAARTGKKVR